MGIAGHTAPSSGMEHTISHMLDMRRGARGQDTALHGTQVGVATIVVSIVWRRALQRIADGTTTLTLPDPTSAEHAVRTAFNQIDPSGRMSDECWRDYSTKLTHLRTPGVLDTLHDALTTQWHQHTHHLTTLLGDPTHITTALRAAHAPTRFADLDHPSTEHDVRWALTNCHLMRNRFTIADLCALLGIWTDDDITATLTDAAELGAGL